MLKAETREALKRLLVAMDVTVPSHPKQRTTKHVERYAPAPLFAAVPLGHLEFPLRLTHRDPPDEDLPA